MQSSCQAEGQRLRLRIQERNRRLVGPSIRIGFKRRVESNFIEYYEQHSLMARNTWLQQLVVEVMQANGKANEEKTIYFSSKLGYYSFSAEGRTPANWGVLLERSF